MDNLAIGFKEDFPSKENPHFYKKPKNFLFMTIEKSDGEKSEMLFWIPRFIPNYSIIGHHICRGLKWAQEQKKIQ